MKSFFSPKDVSRLFGVSYRQISYWAQTGFVKPSYKRRGRYGLYIATDLFKLWVLHGLRAEGVSIQALRPLAQTLSEAFTKVEALEGTAEDRPSWSRWIVLVKGLHLVMCLDWALEVLLAENEDDKPFTRFKGQELYDRIAKLHAEGKLI